MKSVVRLVLITLLAGMAIPRHACCALNSVFANAESESACCCSSKNQPLESNPNRPLGEGPCCKQLDLIVQGTQDASFRLIDSDSLARSSLWPGVNRLDNNLICSFCTREKSSSPPRPVRIVFCHWTC